jgi:hypothetical protein
MSQAETVGQENSSGASGSPGAAGSSGGPTTPDDRATTFQAVKGEPEHYSGETLLVSAYAVLWVIVIAWVALAWRKSAGLTRRLDDLERVIDDAARKQRPGA